MAPALSTAMRAPSDAAGDQNGKSGRRPLRLVAIAVVVVLVIAGATTAVVLLARQDDGPPPPATVVAPRPATTTSPAVERREQPAAGLTPAPGSAEDAAEGGGSSGSTREEDDRSAQTRPARAFTGPEKALREHWRAIGDGDFAAAHARFSTKYRASHAIDVWSAGIRRFRPEITIVQLDEITSAGDRATVRVIIATRDRGAKGDASRCHIFHGRVRVVRESGRWSYDPAGLRELRKGGIDPSTDRRCEPLFR